MNRLRMMTLLVALVPVLPVVAQNECDRPWPVVVPEELPDRDTMLALQREVKAYIEQANDYLACNEARQASLPEDDYETPRKRQNLLNLYNNTVDEMQTVGERYNVLVRAFKAQEEAGEEAGEEDPG